MPNSIKMAFSVREVAEILGLGRSLVYEAVRRGELPSIRIGTRILIPRAGVDALMKGTTAPDVGAAVGVE